MMMNPKRIHSGMNVAELLSGWPQAIPVFIHYRMACVGCSMAAFETLEDAARIYNVPLDRLLGDIEAVGGEIDDRARWA